jgi:hypothetical protein
MQINTGHASINPLREASAVPTKTGAIAAGRVFGLAAAIQLVSDPVSKLILQIDSKEFPTNDNRAKLKPMKTGSKKRVQKSKGAQFF